MHTPKTIILDWDDYLGPKKYKPETVEAITRAELVIGPCGDIVKDRHSFNQLRKLKPQKSLKRRIANAWRELNT